MKALGLAYHRYIEMNRAAPKSWDELLTSASSQGDSSSAASLARLKAQNAVVFFGIHFREAMIGSSNYVLGFESKTPKSGGLALLLDGAVTHLTPAQLCGHLKVQAQVDRAVFGRSPPVTVMFSPNVQANPEIPPHLAHLANQAPPGPPSFPSIPKNSNDSATQANSNSKPGQDDSSNSGFGPLVPPGLAGASIPTASGEMPGSEDPPATKSGDVANPFGASDSSDSSTSTRVEVSLPDKDSSVPNPFGSSSSTGASGTTDASPPPSTAGSTTPTTDSGKVANPFAPLNPTGSSSAAKSDAPPSDDSASSSVPNPFGAGATTTSSATQKEENDEGNKPVVNPFLPQSSSSAGESADSSARGKMVESEIVGGSGGSPFRHVGSVEQTVVGVRYRLGQWQGKDRLGGIEPLYANSSLRPGWEIVVARDGYAVGAVQVDGDQFVNAIRLAFMRLEDGRLNTKDTYVSDWIGTPEGTHQKTLNGKGSPVVGIVGRGLAIVDAIGLVFVER